jgi:hypothetical protein
MFMGSYHAVKQVMMYHFLEVLKIAVIASCEIRFPVKEPYPS